MEIACRQAELQLVLCELSYNGVPYLAWKLWLPKVRLQQGKAILHEYNFQESL